MRLLKYISLSGLSEDINKFRAFTIKLVDEETGHKKIIKRIQRKYNLDEDVIYLIEELNVYLRKIYKGKFKFDFCLNEGKEIDEVKINKKNKGKIKMKYLNASSKLGKIKTIFEKRMKEGE